MPGLQEKRIGERAVPITPARERAIHSMMEQYDSEIHKIIDSLAAMRAQIELVHRLTGPIPPEGPPPEAVVSRETMPYPDSPRQPPAPGQEGPFPDVSWPGPGSDPAADAAGFVTGPDR